MPLTWLNWFSNCVTDVLAWLIAVSGYMTSCSYLAVLCSYWLMVLRGAAIYVLISDCIFESAAMIAAVSMPNWPFARVGRMAITASATTATFNRVGRHEGPSSG